MKELIIDYSGTGIKSLRIISTVVLIAGLVAAFIFVAVGSSEEEPTLYIYSVVSAIFGVIHFAALRALATIAENSLYQKTRLEMELQEKEVSIVIKKD